MGGVHAHQGSSSERSLLWAFFLTSSFLIAEIIGGLLTGSLALLSDAGHMFTDSAGLAIALVAVKVAQRPADTRRTFGYYRLEILAAAFNAVLLCLVAAYIFYEATQRIYAPADVQSLPMLAIAVLGLVVNFISLRILSAGQSKSLNVKGAYLEVWGDFIGSLGVIGAALGIWLTGWTWIDPVIAVAIALWVVPRALTLLSESVNILLQGVPEGIALDAIDTRLRSLPPVREVHNLHVWSLTSGRNVLSAHLVTDPAAQTIQLRKEIELMLHDEFEIAHTTIQFEDGSGHGVEPE